MIPNWKQKKQTEIHFNGPSLFTVLIELREREREREERGGGGGLLSESDGER